MKIITTIKEMQAEMLSLRSSQKSIGFVPTMGYLHEGHVSLMQKAKLENDTVVLSIFVNPLQFGPKEDLATYPRDFERDQQIAINQGVDFLFYPTPEEMYPYPLSSVVSVKERTNVLCGKSRPGHFDGVATVVSKLFNIVMPHRAYFGMKDAQQVAVIDGLIRDLNFPITLVPVQTVREEDGLAKSSRNVYLSPAEREEATTLYKSLKQAETMIVENRETDPLKIINTIQSKIEKETSGTIDYIEIYSYPELAPITKLSGQIIIALAVKFSKARLIDNMILEIKE